MRAILIFILIWFAISLTARAQYVDVKGRVTDDNGTPVGFALVNVKTTLIGASTNAKGDYRLKLLPGEYHLVVRVMGFEPAAMPLTLGQKDTIFNITINLHRVSKDTLPQDSTIAIIKHMIAKRKNIRSLIPTYSNQVYTKTEQRLLDAPKMFFKKDIAKKLNLDSNRQGIISLTESLSQFNFKQPDHIKQITEASKLSPYNNVFNFNTALDVQLDLSRNYLRWDGMTEHSFISPIASSALRFYSYRLIKQYKDGDLLIDVIKIIPKHYDEHLFSGNLYIVDKLWTLYAVDLHLYPSAHIDYIDSVNIRQQYRQVKDSVWLPQSLKFSYNGGLFGFKYGGYFQNIYNNFNTDTVFAADYFNEEVLHTDKPAYTRSESYWNDNRMVPLLNDEQQFYHITQPVMPGTNSHRVDSLQKTNNKFKIVDYFFDGYTLHNYKNNSSWNFPGPYRMFFFNTVEGYGFDFAIRYNKQYLDHHRSLAIVPEFRYGSADKIFNANVGVTYFYNPFKQASIYGNFGTNFLDLNNNGTISPFLNSLSTLLLGNNLIKLYESKFIILGTDGEIANGVLLNGQIEYSDRRSVINSNVKILNKTDSINLTSNNPLLEGDIPLFPHNRALIFKSSITFTFDQEYEINPDGKFIRHTKYPRLRFNYRRGIPLFDSDVDYDFVSADFFQDHLHMGILGYSSYFLSAGAFINNTSTYYPDFNQFKGGQSFFFDPSIGSFHFLNFYTYSTYKPYFEAHLEHNFAGLLTSHIPILTNLNVQEIIGGSFLHQGLLPDYKEFYFGFRRAVIRFDYGFGWGEYSHYRGFRFIYNF